MKSKIITIDQLVRDIKELKIQSASTITKTSLIVIRNQVERNNLTNIFQLEEVFDRVKKARPTEPFVGNCFDYLLWQARKNNKFNSKEIILSFDVLLSRLDLINEQITKNGLSLIKKDLKIFTHCHSTNVEKILLNAFEKGFKFSVYLTETRPKFQGRTTAENLIMKGIRVTMVTDSEASYLISNNDQTKIDLILLGTDAIFADGSCYNKVGSYGISLSAKSANIPLYIIGSLLKFSDKEISIEERLPTELWPEKPKKLTIYNPAFDKVQADFINNYVTEFGLIKPQKIRQVVKKNYPWIFSTNGKLANQKKEEKLSYLHIDEKINRNKFLIATYKIKSKVSLKEAAEDLAGESSVGTWTSLSTQTEETFNRLSAKVIDINIKNNKIVVAYPMDDFEPGNIPQLLSSVAGNIFGMKRIDWLRLLDLDLPEEYVVNFSGPQIGANNIRKITGVNGPLVGSIIKPKMGLTWQEHTKVALEVFENGINLVKDDENLTDQVFNPFEKRVIEIMKNLKLKVKNWQQKIYAFNVTAETETMIDRAKFIKSQDGNCAMIDILTAGFSALQTLTSKKLGLIIHGHRAMHAALTKNPDHGISMLVLAKLSRLAGIDELHTGTVIGKMEGSEDEVLEINKFLLSEWYGLKTTLPVASGGLHPGMIPDLIKILGTDVILNFGGGIHGHPNGSGAGARAVIQAVEAVKRKINLNNFAKDHIDLRIALDKWNK